jgi:hypothetical protein
MVMPFELLSGDNENDRAFNPPVEINLDEVAARPYVVVISEPPVIPIVFTHSA